MSEIVKTKPHRRKAHVLILDRIEMFAKGTPAERQSNGFAVAEFLDILYRMDMSAEDAHATATALETILLKFSIGHYFANNFVTSIIEDLRGRKDEEKSEKPGRRIPNFPHP